MLKLAFFFTYFVKNKYLHRLNQLGERSMVLFNIFFIQNHFTDKSQQEKLEEILGEEIFEQICLNLNLVNENELFFF